MLVPIELQSLSLPDGHLSPEFALGWRIGTYVREFFSGLDDVRLAAASDTDAARALSRLRPKAPFQCPVTIAIGQRPWDFLAFHYPTGTALRFLAVPNRTELPAVVKELEPLFRSQDRSLSLRAIRCYRAAIDLLIARILKNRVEDCCRIEEIRVRFLGVGTVTPRPVLRCRRCGAMLPAARLLETEGTICCAYCAGFEPSWLNWA